MKTMVMTVVLVGAVMLGFVAGQIAPIGQALADNATPLAMQVLQQRGDQARQKAGALVVVRATADVSGLTLPQVVDALETGKSPAQVATDNGATRDELVAAAEAQVDDLLALAVLNGNLTEAEADRIRQAAAGRIQQAVDNTNLGAQIAAARERLMRAMLVKATADETGLPVREVVSRVRNGESLSQVAAAEGADRDAIIELALSRMSDALQRPVDRGLLTDAERQQIIEECRVTSQTLMDETR